MDPDTDPDPEHCLFSCLYVCAAPPRIVVSPPEEVTVLPGEDSLQLTCTVECHPACTIHWWSNAAQITGNKQASHHKKYKGRMECVLLI